MRLFIAIALIMCLPVHSGAWTLSRNFDNGTEGALAQSASAFDYAGTATRFSSEQPAHGAKCARLEWPQCSAECGWGVAHGEIELPSWVPDGGEIWMRAYTKFQSGWRWNDRHVKVMRLHTQRANADHTGWLSFIGHGGEIISSNETALSAGAPDEVAVNLGINYNVGAWQCLELYVKLGRPGVLRMWKNGVLIHEDRQSPTSTAGGNVNLATFSNTWNSPGSPQRQAQWWDEIVITTDRPPARDAAGNPMIGIIGAIPPSSGVSEPKNLRLN